MIFDSYDTQEAEVDLSKQETMFFPKNSWWILLKPGF